MVFLNINQKTTCLMIKLLFQFTVVNIYNSCSLPNVIFPTKDTVNPVFLFYIPHNTMLPFIPSVCSVKHSVHLVYCILYLRYCIHQHLYIIYRCRVGPYLFHNYSICVLILFRLYCCVVKQIMYSVNSLELRSCFSSAEVFK